MSVWCLFFFFFDFDELVYSSDVDFKIDFLFLAFLFFLFFFFQAEDGIRDLVRSRGLGDVYKRQVMICTPIFLAFSNLDDPEVSLVTKKSSCLVTVDDQVPPARMMLSLILSLIHI